MLGVRLYLEQKAQGKAADVSNGPAQLEWLVDFRSALLLGPGLCGPSCLPETGISNSCCGCIRFRGGERPVFAGARFEGVRRFPVTEWRRQGLGMGSGVLKMCKTETYVYKFYPLPC